MNTTTETITTKSGIALVVEKRADERLVEVSLRTTAANKCFLHWGLQPADKDTWEIPPRSIWPQGTNQVGQDALQTPFVKQNGERGILIRLSPTGAPLAIGFVLFFPDRKSWDNNGGRNYQIQLPKAARSHAELQQAHQARVGAQKPL